MFSLSKHQAKQIRRNKGIKTIPHTSQRKDNGINKIQQNATVKLPKLADTTKSSIVNHQSPKIKSQQNMSTKPITINQTKSKMSSPRATIYLEQTNGLTYFQRTNLQTDRKVTILIDTGANNNYISLQATKNAELTPLPKATTVKTTHGISKITSYVQVNIFSHDIKFLVLENTGNFDLIFGMNGLQKINAVISFSTLEMSYIELANHTIDVNHTQLTKSTIKKEYQKNPKIEGNHTKPSIKKACKTDHNRKVHVQTNTRINNPITSKMTINQSRTPKNRHTIVHNELDAKTTPDKPKKVQFNWNQKIDEKEINQYQPSNRIDKTKPKFKMKSFLLERFLSGLQQNDHSTYHGL